MIAFWLFFKGLTAGFAIAAPVGPVNVLCASRTLSKGRRAGLISGLGAASADAFYGSIAGFSISFVIDFLKREEFWFRVVGGLLLIGIGITYYRKPARKLEASSSPTSAHSDYASTLLLTLTNPTTVLSFLAILTATGMSGGYSRWLTFLLVGGIFLGSMSWWVVLVLIVDRLRDRFDDHVTGLMNRVAGIAIGLFGVVTFTIGMIRGR